jgi:hypothetical protein
MHHHKDHAEVTPRLGVREEKRAGQFQQNEQGQQETRGVEQLERGYRQVNTGSGSGKQMVKSTQKARDYRLDRIIP